jgi:subfamily B ATP-binding cassette protein MsbA
MLNMLPIQSVLKTPAYRLILKVAKENRKLIAINLSSNIISVLLEGGSIGLIYIAASIAAPNSNEEVFGKTSIPFINHIASYSQLSPIKVFVALILGAVVLQCLQSIFAYFNKVATAQISAKAQTFVTKRVFEQIMSLSYSCVSRYKVGDLIMYANDSALAVDRQIEEINSMIVSIAFMLAYSFIIIKLSAFLALTAAAIGLVVASVQYYVVPRIRVLASKVTSYQVEVAENMTESIQGLSLIHIYGTQKRTINKINESLKNYRKMLINRSYKYYLTEPILDSLPMVALACITLSSIALARNNAPILPILVTFLLSLQRLAVRLKAFSTIFTRFADNSGRMLRLETILNQADKEYEKSGIISFRKINNDIVFLDVSLKYGDSESFALKELNFTIPRNKVTAIIGESGSGKSSILNLLLGIYQPTSGKVIVNKEPLSNFEITEFRQHIGMVSQDSFLFNDTIVNNLRYGCPTAPMDEVIFYCKAAQAHNFIVSLPDGYQTIVGERGYRLSGGQRQRLALARAMIKNPELLILDEATSALDSESEKLVQEALETFRSGRTIVVVAHRLSTVINADQIIVVENGSVVDKGRHVDLVRRKGPYNRYWALQSDAPIIK